MSMLSAQRDKLREVADDLDHTHEVSTPWVHYHLTPMIRNAADTIWDLRNRCSDLEKQNTKLRELAEAMYHKVHRAAFDGSTGWEELKELQVSMHDLGIEV